MAHRRNIQIIMKNVIKNIAASVSRGASKAWQWLSGSKRRVAIVSGFVMQITKPHTLVYKAAELSFYLFGGADATEVIKNKLPTGLKK